MTQNDEAIVVATDCRVPIIHARLMECSVALAAGGWADDKTEGHRDGATVAHLRCAPAATAGEGR